MSTLLTSFAASKLVNKMNKLANTFDLNRSTSTVRPQPFDLNRSTSTVRPQPFDLNRSTYLFVFSCMAQVPKCTWLSSFHAKFA